MIGKWLLTTFIVIGVFALLLTAYQEDKSYKEYKGAHSPNKTSWVYNSKRPSDDYSVQCINGVQYYLGYEVGFPVIDKDTLTFVRCES